MHNSASMKFFSFNLCRSDSAVIMNREQLHFSGLFGKGNPCQKNKLPDIQTADLDSNCFENCPPCKTDKHLAEKGLSANQNCLFMLTYVHIQNTADRSYGNNSLPKIILQYWTILCLPTQCIHKMKLYWYQGKKLHGQWKISHLWPPCLHQHWHMSTKPSECCQYWHLCDYKG